MLFPEGGTGAGKSSKDSLTISKADLDTIHDIQNESRGQATVDLSGLSQTDDTIIEELEVDIPSSETKPDVATSAALTTEQRKRLSEELARHEVWPTKRRPIGLYKHGVFDIKLKIGQENWTHSEPPRRTSPAQKEAIDKTLEEHDEMGLSEPGESPYTSGIVLVPQKDKIRLCNDYRPLNSVTEDDQYFLPTTDEVHDCLHDSHFFTIVDCNKGYHQFGLSDRARLLLAFATYRGVRIWNRMPFGPKNAVAFFQRTIDKILGKYRRKCAIAYLDDIIIFSPDFDSHVRDVGNVLKELADAGLTIAPKKCAFAFKSLQVLGYRATELGTMVDEEKVKAVKALPSPKTATEARRLFAMASWYRRFIPRFAILARPMNKAINRQPFAWTEIEEDAMTKIKEALTTPPVLRRADFKRPFILDVDASAVGFGAALIQKDDEGKEHPIIFLSRQTKDAERRYPATHLELQAIEWAVKKLRHYLDGGKMTVRSDHKALLWLWNLKSTDLSHRLQRLNLSLAPLREKIKIEYRKGTSNQVADALSRAPVEEEDTTKDEIMMQIPIKEEKEPEHQKKKSALVATLDSHSQTLFQNKVSTSKNAASQSLSQTKLSTSQNTVTADSTSQEIPTTTSSSLTFDIDEKTSWAKAYRQDPHYQRIWRRLVNNDKSRRQTEDAEEDTGNYAARGKRDRVGSEGSQADEEKKKLEQEGLKEKVDVDERKELGKMKKGGRGWERLRSWKPSRSRKGKDGHNGGRVHDDGKDLKKEKGGHNGGLGRDDGQDLVAGGNEKEEVDIQEKETSPMTEGASGSTRRRSPRLKTSRRTRRSKPPTQFFVQEGFLFERKGSSTDEVVKLCVPEEKIPLVIHEFHNSSRAGHPSSQRTIDAMKETFTFPDFSKRIKEHVKSCFECQLNKTRHHLPYGELHPIFSPSQVFHTIGIDFVTGLTPNGREHYDSITVCADKFSKFAFFWPSKTTDTASDTAQRFLERVYPYTGLPQRIISDRDVRFTSEFWQTLVKKLDIQHSMSTAYHPQTDGQVERLNQQLATLLRHTVALDQHDWAERLPSAMMAYNQTIHETTKQRPYLLVFGRLPRIFPLQFLTPAQPKKESGVDRLLSLHQEVQDQIVKAQERQKRQYDIHHQHWRPKGGDWVWVRTEHYKTRLDPTQRSKIKLGPKHIGPFRIRTEVTPGAYEVDTPSWFKGHSVLPIQTLEPFLGDPTKVIPRKITGVEEEGAQPEQRVITFLGRRPTQFLDGDRYDYLVKWIGDIQPTWQCDRRLPGLHWARRDLEKHLRQELGINRLSPTRELILSQAKDRARILKVLDEGEKNETGGSGTSLSSVGAGVTDRIEKGQAN
ncbi:hypothetical protein CF336_g7941 [Tilletia laevis]|nr:hypothetical protein CF336_g7941 [Tilletia laevis]